MLRWILPLLLAAAVVSAQPALTASNPGARGVASAPVSGYEISGVGYELGTDAETVVGVMFRIAPANASHVTIHLSEGGAPYSCTVAGNAVSCPITPGEPIKQIDLLTVAAA